MSHGQRSDQEGQIKKDLISKVASYLDKTDNVADLIIMRKGEVLSIVPNSRKPFLEFLGWEDERRSAENCWEIDEVHPDSNPYMRDNKTDTVEDSDEYEDDIDSVESRDLVEGSFEVSNQPEASGDQNVPTTSHACTQSHEGHASSSTQSHEVTTKAPYNFVNVIVEMAKRVHNGSIIYKCQICTICNTFQSELLIRDHISAMHSGLSKTEKTNLIAEQSKVNEQLYKCRMCNVVESATSKGIKLHISETHFKDQLKAKNLVGVTKKVPSKQITGQNAKGKYWLKTKIDEAETATAGGVKIWICSLCPKFTDLKRFNMKKHILKKHKRLLVEAAK